MLLFDIINRKNLNSYMGSSLKQIETCLEKNMYEFMKTSQYSKIKSMGKEPEMEFKEWNSTFGNQVKATIERQQFLLEDQKKNEMKRIIQETETQKALKKQNEWSDNFEVLNNSNISKKKRKGKRKGKNKMSKGGLIRWTETDTNSLKNNKDSISKWNTEASNVNTSFLSNNGMNLSMTTKNS